MGCRQIRWATRESLGEPRVHLDYFLPYPEKALTSTGRVSPLALDHPQALSASPLRRPPYDTDYAVSHLSVEPFVYPS